MTKKRKFNKSTGRKYTGDSYDAVYGRAHSKRRSQSNQARRVMKKKLTAKHGAKKAASMMKGKDVAHKKANGGNAPSNLTLQSKSKNRGRSGEGNRKKGKRK